MAIAAAGCIVCPLNARWSEQEVQHALKLTSASILIADPSFSSIVAAALSANANLLVLYTTPGCSAGTTPPPSNLAMGPGAPDASGSIPAAPSCMISLGQILEDHAGGHARSFALCLICG
jgi:acyl-CoA synthetase (AMP-forming)/AMP-acid ligase II